MPSLNSSEVKVQITTEADNKGVDSAEKKIGGFSESAVNASKKVALALSGMALAAGALALSFTKDFAAQEDALARLEQGLKNVTGNSKDTAVAIKELSDQASDLQKVTRFADEQIESGQAMLTTFKLSKDSIKQLTPSMLDMAEAMRRTSGETVDLNQLGIMFGKVMGNAEGGVEGLATGLKKMGVIMTDEQAAVFKFGTEAERAAMLTQIMDDNFKGFAEAGGKTFSGRLDIMNNQIGEIKESIGQMVANALMPMVDYIATNALSAFENFQAFLSEHKTLTEALAITIGVVLVAAFASLAVGAVSSLLAITVAGAPVFLLVGAIALAVGGLYLAYETILPKMQEIVFRSDDIAAAHKREEDASRNLAIAKDELNAAEDRTRSAMLQVKDANMAVEQAQINYDTALKNHGPQALETRQAENRLEEAKLRVRDANRQQTDAVQAEITKQKEYIKQNKETIDAHANAKRAVDDHRSSWQRLTDAIGGAISKMIEFVEKSLKAAATPGIHLPGFADGVQNFGGGLALVGENGPEIVNLPRGSDVIPNDKISSAGGQPLQITQNIYSGVDFDFALRELAFAVSRT